MKGIALVVIVISCCVFTGCCQAQQESTPVSGDAFWPQATHLSGGELSPLLEKWDRYVASDDLTSRGHAIMMVEQYVERPYVYYGARVLRYKNPEIKDRVVALYLRECAKPGFPAIEGGEGGHEYMELLMTVAESTMDPRIWDYELVTSLGDLRSFYLASVNADRTLEYLLESKCGVRPKGDNWPVVNPHSFYHASPKFALAITNAFTLLSMMSTQSPKAIQDKREKVLAFVKEHHAHFTSLRPEAHPVAPEGEADYEVRNGALDVLALIGGKADVELVQDIMRGAPVVDLKRVNSRIKIAREQVAEKGMRIIQLIRYR